MRAGRTAAAAIAMGSALLAAAAPAAAERRLADAVVQEAELAGDGVVFQEDLRRPLHAYAASTSHRLVLLEGGRRRTLVRVVGTLDVADEPFDAVLDWDASADALVWRVDTTSYEGAGPDDFSEIRGGPLRGPYRRLAKCEQRAEFPFETLAVYGSTAAYRDDCRVDGAVVLRDLAAPATPPERTLPRGDAVDVAGRFAAIKTVRGDAAEIAVHDRASGAEVYRATGLDATEEYLETFALQDDGKLAAPLKRVDSGTCPLATFSPADPAPHPIGHMPCFAPLEMAADRVAFFARTRGVRQLRVHHLARAADTILASFPEAGPDAGSSAGRALAFDGLRTVYAVQRCDGRRTLLLRKAIGGPVRRDRDALTCPLPVAATSVPSRPLTGDDDARMRLPLACPRGCFGTVTVGDADVGQPFAVAPGRGPRGVALYLDDPTAARVSSRGSARVRLRIETIDRVGRHTARSLTVTVRR